jgi:hypothetical protein
MTIAKSAPKLPNEPKALVRIGTVRPLPFRGRMPWFANEFRPGEGGRTSLGPGGAHYGKSIEYDVVMKPAGLGGRR